MIRLGVMGTGMIVRRVWPSLVAAPSVGVAAVGSRDRSRAAAFCAEHGLGDDAAATYEELAERADIDAVYLALPNYLHVPWAIRLARAGKHVLVEKPLTCWEDEAQRVADEARAAGVLVVEGFKYLHHPQTDRLIGITRAAMDDPDGSAIGALRAIRVERHGDLRTPGPTPTRFSHTMQGGAMMDLGCYCVSIVSVLTGEHPERCRASAALAAPLPGESRGVDGTMSFGLSLPSGVLAFGSTSIESHRGGTVLELLGTHGSVRTGFPFAPDPERADLELRRWAPGDGPESAADPAEVVTVRGGGEPFVGQFERFAAAVAGRAEPLPSLEWSVANARTIEALYSSAGIEMARSPEP